MPAAISNQPMLPSGAALRAWAAHCRPPNIPASLEPYLHLPTYPILTQERFRGHGPRIAFCRNLVHLLLSFLSTHHSQIYPTTPHRSGFEGMGRAELRAWCQGQIARYKARLAGCRPGWFAGSGGRLPRLIAGAAVVGFLVCNSAVCCRLRAAATCCHPCTTHGPADPTVLEVCGQLPHDCLRQAPGAAPALSQRWNEHASAKCCTCFLWLSSAEAI